MNSGHANKAAIRLVLWSLAALMGLFVAAWVGQVLGGIILAFHKVFIALWIVFIVVVVYLFRDPDPTEPGDLNAIVSPAHGQVDGIEETVENEFMKGACRRISIHVSLFDVHVQKAPVTGTIAHFDYRRPLNEDGTAQAENLLVGFDVTGRPATRVAVRLVGGTWGKRIVPWIRSNDVVARSVRIGMMRPSSRVELYLPPGVKLQVNPGDELAGGQSVVAKFE